MGLRVWTPETAFPGLLVVSGLLFAAVLPPCQAPDENKHFLRAYHVSEGHLAPEVTELGWLGGNLPVSVGRVSDTSKYLRFHSNVKVNDDTLRSLASDRLEPERRRPTSFEGAEANLFVGYVPQAVAIMLGRFVGLNPLSLFYAARLANLMLAAIALSITLRMAPAGKLVFGMVALLPVTVQQFASVSPDASIISVAFLLTALLLRAALVGVPAAWSLVSRTAGLAAWLAGCKFTLAPLTLLYLGVPRKVLGSRVRYLNGAVVIAAALLLPPYPLIAGRARETVSGPREDLPVRPAEPAEQMQVLRSDPLKFPVVVANSWARVPYLHHLFTLGWLDTEIPRPLAYPYAVVLLLVCLANRSPLLPLRLRAAAFAAVVGCLLVIFLGFYLFVTPPGDPVIRDMQGRYFIPFLPLALLLLSNSSWFSVKPRSLLGLALAAGAAEVTVAIGTMVGRYYHPPVGALKPVVASVVIAAIVATVILFAHLFHLGSQPPGPPPSSPPLAGDDKKTQ